MATKFADIAKGPKGKEMLLVNMRCLTPEIDRVKSIVIDYCGMETTVTSHTAREMTQKGVSILSIWPETVWYAMI